MTRSLRWAAAAAILVLFGIGVGSAEEPGGKKAKGMTEATTKKIRIPPIDAKLPAKIQTATFALG